MNEILRFSLQDIPPHTDVHAEWLAEITSHGEKILSERIELVLQEKPMWLPQWM